MRRTEDYLQAIYELSRQKGFARVKEIAEVLGVKPASVTEMLEKLSRSGYVVYRKRMFVTLTEEGWKIAKAVEERREILVKFLQTLGVSRDVAERDAHNIEHYLHPETVERLKKFIKFIEGCPGDPKWLDHFRKFCETGTHPCDRCETR